MADRPYHAPHGAHWLGGHCAKDARRGAPGDEHAAFADGVARPLRTAERLAPDFEERLMAAVRAVGSADADPNRRTGFRTPTAAPATSGLGWWRRPRTVRVSPLLGLALAAGFAGVICLGTLELVGLRSRGAERLVAPSGSATGALAATPAAVPETVHVVRFVLVERRAERVALVGDFNGWAMSVTPLAPAGPSGAWTVSLPLPPGRHEYAFVVDGRRWVADPYAPSVRDEYATESSVVTVGGLAARRT